MHSPLHFPSLNVFDGPCQLAVELACMATSLQELVCLIGLANYIVVEACTTTSLQECR